MPIAPYIVSSMSSISRRTFASTLATGLLLAYFGEAGVIYAAFAMTLVIFILAEVLPKTAAFNAPDRMALAVASPVARTVRLFSPLLRVVEPSPDRAEPRALPGVRWKNQSRGRDFHPPIR